MKRCGKCGAEKPETDFHRWNQGGGLQPWCKACRKDYDRDYHARNRERRLVQVKQRQRRFNEWHDELKRSTPCADCGQHFHATAMHWDHLPGFEKLDEVSNLARRGKTLRARAEMAKCEL